MVSYRCHAFWQNKFTGDSGKSQKSVFTDDRDSFFDYKRFDFIFISIKSSRGNSAVHFAGSADGKSSVGIKHPRNVCSAASGSNFGIYFRSGFFRNRSNSRGRFFTGFRFFLYFFRSFFCSFFFSLLRCFDLCSFEGDFLCQNINRQKPGYHYKAKEKTYDSFHFCPSVQWKKFHLYILYYSTLNKQNNMPAA